MPRRTIAALALLVVSASAIAARQAPPRDRTERQMAGTARVSGRVLSATSSRPLKQTIVRIFSDVINGDRVAATDRTGRYEFRDLPAGRYTLSAARPGFMPVRYGAAKPAGAGRALTLHDGELIEHIDFALGRGGVISGRVVDEVGEPFAGVRVEALRVTKTAGGPSRTEASGWAETDDLGQFRVHSLLPGSYVVAATLRPFEYGPQRPEGHDGYATTYFPGTPALGEAQRVRVPPAGEVSGVVLPLVASGLVKVAGAVRTSQGTSPAGAWLQIRGTGDGPMLSTGTTVEADGEFSFSGITAGRYLLAVDQDVNGLMETGLQEISVNGDQDVTDLTLQMVANVRVTGQIVFEGDGSPPKDVVVLPMPATASFSSFKFATAQPDGTFVLEVSPTLPSVIRANTKDPHWMLKSATLGGTDVTAQPLTFQSGDSNATLTLVMTDHVTSIDGIVVDAAGRPVRDYTVVLVPEDPRQGSRAPIEQPPSSRPDAEGKFLINKVAPGGYVAAAIDVDVPIDDMVEDQIRAKGTKIALAEGEQKHVRLEIIGLE